MFVAECFKFFPCWVNAFPAELFNGGPGYLLSDLGVDFSDPSVRARFEDGGASFSVIQNDITSVNLTNLRLTLMLPEPGMEIGIALGTLWLAALGPSSRRPAKTASERP